MKTTPPVCVLGFAFFCASSGLSLATLPSDWISTDIGAPTIPGSTTFLNDEFTISGSGSDIYNSSDQFQFCYITKTGDFEIIAEITHIKVAGDAPKTDGGGTHGVMIRDALTGGARHATLFIQPSNPWNPLLFSSRRTVANGTTWRQGTTEFDASPSYWLRMVRTGDFISCYHSPDGQTWIPHKPGSCTIRGLPQTMYVGMAVCARTNNATSFAKFRNVTVGNTRWPYQTSWLGNDVGGGSYTIPGQVNGLFVDRFDNAIYTTATYEESGRGGCRFDTNGQMQSIMSGTQFRGGLAITADNTYVYQAAREDKDKGNYGIRRFTKDGAVANFNGANNLLILNPSAEDASKQIRGLAMNRATSELYAAVPAFGTEKDRVMVIRTTDMTVLGNRTFDFDRPKGMVVDNDGKLWIARGNQGATPASGELVRMETNGTILRTITGLDDPQGLACDASNRIYVTVCGAENRIRIYNTDGSSAGTLGESGGIFSGRRGEVSPLKLNRPVGVGVDAAGNVYVASNANEKLPQFELRKFNTSGQQQWHKLGLEFIDAADVDPLTDGQEVFTKNHRYVMDWTKPAGQGWKYAGYTLDPLTYPMDPRLFIDNPGGVQIRRINGKKFMFLHQMYSRWLCVYRFNEGSEIAIPCVVFVHQNTKTTQEMWPPTQPSSGRWIWSDADGDGSFDSNEFVADGANDTALWGWWVDTNGDVWSCSRVNGMRRYAMLGLDATHGFPRYSPHSVTNYAPPSGFSSACRSIYIAATDTMYVAGFTSANPWTSNYGTGAFGRVIARFNNWSNAQTRSEAWRFDCDFYQPKSDNSGFLNAPKSWAVVSDRLYYSDIKTGTIHEHDSMTKAYRKTLIPGPEVCGTTGWIDTPHAMNAWKRANGEYLLFVEEDDRCKNLIYREAADSIYLNTFDSTTSPFVIEVNGEGTTSTQLFSGNRAVTFSDSGATSGAETVFRMRLTTGNALVNRINAIYASDPLVQPPVTLFYRFKLERHIASNNPIAANIKASIQFNNYDGILIPRFPTGEPSIFATQAYATRESSNPALGTVDCNDSKTLSYRFSITPNNGARTISSLDFRMHVRVAQNATPEGYAIDDLEVLEVRD